MRLLRAGQFSAPPLNCGVMRKFVLTVLSAITLGASPSSKAADTVIREETFSLTLPGAWSGGYNAESRAWGYVTAKGNEGITVGILQRTNDPAPEAMRSDLENYLRVRREQELKLGGVQLTLSEPRRSEQQGAHIAVFEGTDGAANRRTRTLVIVNRSVAASFYYEALELSDQEFEERASAILSQVGLVQ
jgi:hypothetical protein